MLNTLGKNILIRIYVAILYMAVLSYAVEFLKFFGLGRASELLWAGTWVAIPLVASVGPNVGPIGKGSQYGALAAGLLALPWIGLHDAPYWLALLVLFGTIQLFVRSGAVSVWAASISDPSTKSARLPRRPRPARARMLLSALLQRRRYPPQRTKIRAGRTGKSVEARIARPAA